MNFPIEVPVELRYRPAAVTYVYPKTEQGAELAPCYACEKTKACAASGIICLAFDRYVNGTNWRRVPREPSAAVTAIAALRHREQVERDESEALQKRLRKKRRRQKNKLAARVVNGCVDPLFFGCGVRI